MLSQIRLSSVTCVHPTQGLNFSGIFLHHIVAWPSGNSLTKNHEDRPRGSPPPSEQISLTGAWLYDSSKVVKPPISSTHVWFGYLISWWVSCLTKDNHFRSLTINLIEYISLVNTWQSIFVNVPLEYAEQCMAWY